MTPSHPSMRLLAEGQFLDEVGAGDEIRTRDIQLGRLALYQLSYSRKPEIGFNPPRADDTTAG